MSKHSHWNNVYIQLINYSLVWYFMKVSDVWDSHIVHKNWNIQPLKLFAYSHKKIGVLTFGKICNNGFCLNLTFLIKELNFFKSFLDFLFISGDHANVESELSKLLAKTQPYSVASTCDNGPRVSSISFSVVFCWYYDLNEIPQQFSN